MAVLNKSAFEALYGTSGSTFPDNTTGLISEADMRQFGKDIADSLFPDTIGSAVQNVYKTILSADILTANTTPVEIVAAPGANRIIVPMSPIVVYLNYNSAAYATNTEIQIEINGTGISLTNSTLLTQTADRFILLGTNNGQIFSTSLANQSLDFRVNTGDPTAGDSTIAIALSYKIIELGTLPL